MTRNNPGAPRFMAWTVIGISPWPAMKMIGMSSNNAYVGKAEEREKRIISRRHEWNVCAVVQQRP